jgi:rhamnogalacturonan endolyase
MTMRAALLFLLATAAAAPAAEIFRDDFTRYPAGWLSYPVGVLNAAIQEYHYLPHRGVPLGPWANAICHLDAWAVGEEDGRRYLEQHLTKSAPMFANPIFITGDPEWSDYAVEVSVKPLAVEDGAGVVFRYHTNRHYYWFGLSGGKEAQLALHLPLEKLFRVPQWKTLASAPFASDARRYCRLKVVSEGPKIRAYIDGRLVLEASDSEILKGKAGLMTSGPARFQDFLVIASDDAVQATGDRIRARETELARLRADNPKPVLWRKFRTPRYGAGRNVRFGDLNGDGIPEMLIGQNIVHVSGNFVQLSALTAVTLEGKVLWQIGVPDPRNGLLTSDTPFEIHDLDGDGCGEVVLVKDFQLQVLDGRTGKVRRRIFMPEAKSDAGQKPYTLTNGDSIAFVNFSGGKTPREILVKDRYSNFWIYDSELRLLWSGSGQTGHYPYPVDLDGDGRDELLIGYALWDHRGKQLWSRDKELRDHADGAVMGNFSGDPRAEPRAYFFGSDEGFLMADRHGEILKHVRIGHAQSPSVARFRPDLPGVQLMTVNFWRNPGIVTLFDHDGNILAQEEPIHTGSPLLPVNWRGDGQEFALLSGNPREGGMIDGRLRRVVMFPDDGHPDLAAYVINLTGDARDEIVLWDQEQVWVYTQDRPFAGEKIYAPLRSPDYNESNYRTTVSLPRWQAK